MTYHIHILKGCAPMPLANYLKALGILRLVGEQADGQARGWWEGEQFCLLTKLSREELEAFFLKKYEPTPMLSPWNKGCGFFKPGDPGMAPLEKSTAPRFGRFRMGLQAGRAVAGQISVSDAIIRAIKARTKSTPKGFQTEDQRKLIEESEIYSTTLDSLETKLKNGDLLDRERAEIKDKIAGVRLIASRASQPPSKAEAKRLKGSDGYKTLLAGAERRFKALKSKLIPDCRLKWRGGHADWMAAAVVLNENGEPTWPSLLGTGGNDGNLDFTNNFMQQLVALFEVETKQGGPQPATTSLLRHSLSESSARELAPSAVGQYQPGSAGGANSSTGFDGGNLVNPWDFVLMMEGTICFACQATRRLNPLNVTRISAPFTVHSQAAGFVTSGLEKAERGEQWMPLWHQPATLPDICAMFGEGRAQLGRQTVHKPVDVARAISRLGVARGISSFVRYGYLERNGLATLAVPLGKIAVRENPRAFLINDLARWMNNIERRAAGDNAPGRLIHAERRLTDAVFAALTHDHSPQRWQAILLAAAEIESIQATGTAIEAGPIPPLRPEWVAAVNDGSPEIRLALALGGAFAGNGRDHHPNPKDSIRHHWLPLEPESGARKFRLADKHLAKDSRVVAMGRDAVSDLSAVVQRRMIEAGMSGQRRSRLQAMPGCAAQLDDLAAFLAGQLDIGLIVGLARAFMAIQWRAWKRKYAPGIGQGVFHWPDENWLALRLCLLPFPLDPSHDIPADERIVRLLMADDAGRAIEVARRRLIAVGIRPPFQAGTANAGDARRWVAAMAFPINEDTARLVAGRIDPRFKPQKGITNV